MRVAPVAPDDAFSAVLQLVRAVQTGMQNIENSVGLSGSQLWALWQISADPGQRVSELAKALHIHPSTASNLVDKLELRGYVMRRRGGEDNRVVRLYLADAGLRLVKNIPGPMRGQLRSALQEVPPDVLAGLHRGVATLLALMEPKPGRGKGRQGPANSIARTVAAGSTAQPHLIEGRKK